MSEPDHPTNPYDWWWKMWVPPQKHCQKAHQNVQDAAQAHKETTQEIMRDVPEARHSARNVRMLMQAFIQRMKSISHVILI